MGYILLGVAVTTYIFIVYVQPYLDLWYQVSKAEKTMGLERKELQLQSEKYDLMRKYPEMYNEGIEDNVVGFQYEAPQEECYEDDCDCDECEDSEGKKVNVKSMNKIGY